MKHGARVLAIARRDIIVELSYQLRLVIRMFIVAAALLFLYYVSEFVGQPESLTNYSGNYFDYVAVGLAVTTYMNLGIGAFIARINQEQTNGTFEILLAGPTPLSVLLLAGFIVPFAVTSIEVVLLVGVGMGVVGAGLSLSSILIALPLMLVTILSFCAFGIAGAALVVLAKRGDILTGPLYQITVAFSGVLFPVSLFPAFIRPISYLFPSFYGLRGVRDAILGQASFAEVLDDLLIVSGFCVVLIPLSIWLFRRAVLTAKRVGILGTY